MIEQATADLEAGRPLDVNTATALAALVPQVALDVIPFKFGALSKLVGLSKKLPAGELRKKIAEQGIIKAIGKDAASIIATEMPAEVLQEIITKAQAGVDPFSDEAIAEYKEVAAVVFLTGGLAPYSAIKSKRQAIKDIKLEEVVGTNHCRYSVIENKLSALYRNQEQILKAIKMLNHRR